MYHPFGSLDQKFIKDHCQQQSFFSICGMTAQKMRLQTDKSCIFQLLWFIFNIHQFFHLLFRYQASQKFLFDDRYRLFFHRIHKEISGIIKAVCLLQLPLIFQSDRKNISSSKPEGLGHTSQSIKCAINPCQKKQKYFHRHGSFRFQCLIDPANHKSCEIQSQNGFYKKAAFFSRKANDAIKKAQPPWISTAAGKMILKGAHTSRQDTKDPKAADITHLLRFPSRCRNFPTSLKSM